MPITQTFPYYSDPSPVYTAMENQLSRGATLGTSALGREMEAQRANQSTQLSKGVAELSAQVELKKLAEDIRYRKAVMDWTKQKWQEEKELAKKLGKQEKKSGILKTILQGIGTAAGAYFGGPAGAAVGSQIGSTVGGALSGGQSGSGWAETVSSELGPYMANYA